MKLKMSFASNHKPFRSVPAENFKQLHGLPPGGRQTICKLFFVPWYSALMAIIFIMCLIQTN
jgi:hypothetical protein